MKNIIFILSVVFMISACKKDGSEVIKLPFSKSEYILLKSGKGQKAKLGDFIQFSLLIKGNEGTILADKRDSASWAMEKVVEVDSNTIAVVEMLYTMKMGDSALYKLAIKPEQKSPGMEKIDTIFYFVKLERIFDEAAMKNEQEKKNAEALKKVEDAKPKAAEVEKLTSALLADFKAGKLKDKLQKTSGGVQYYVVEKGTGPKVNKNDLVGVSYHGVLEKDGKEFDGSFKRGDDLKFNVGQGQMIPGWDETMQYLNVGDKAILFLPYSTAYGEEGRPPVIPAKSNLVFYIEVNSAKPVK
ncbi:MAG: FKBP-type peptidyl-prolyl cis-trans isomerase [Saprospiraceae bacterium]|nr:FKBP-type peptidyl-prolyl cis-trans isomerase [Saprospiraceae bacterium]